MVPACHRKNVGSHLHNGRDRYKSKDHINFGAFPPVMFDILQARSERGTGPASSEHCIVGERHRYEELFPLQIHLWHEPPFPHPQGRVSSPSRAHPCWFIGPHY